MSALLKTKKLTKKYFNTDDTLPILQNINLSIYDNEIVVLMGPSGSGKSTLLNVLGTLDMEYLGDIFINGENIKDIDDLSYLRSSQIGFVFQFHHLLPEFTILENLEIPALILGKNISRNILINMLEKLRLKDCANSYPSEISGGERQRVAVLRAFVNRPSLVFADEPTGNLDRGNSELLLNLIVDLKEQYRQSFLIATHDQLLTRIADRVLYLNDGKIKEG
tara:strand:+ start:3220 stop:3885 length:666 start_codon:yes stop_codon:yes gene_type:complete